MPSTRANEAEPRSARGFRLFFPPAPRRESFWSFASVVFLLALFLPRAAAPAASLLDWARSRERLTGDWGGTRERLSERGFELEAVYTGDFVGQVTGERPRAEGYLENWDWTLTVRTLEALGRDWGTFFLYGLANRGHDPSSRVGDLQGVDNIEAPDTVKLYEAWWQKSFFERVSVLAGLYDVNSEFDVLESAALFLHSSFGIGAELGTSGRNGPSIFPVTSVALRLRAEIVPSLLWQTVVADGVPGDPRDPRGTQVRFDENDGLFVASELVLLWFRRSAFPEELERVRRRRIGRGWGELPYTAKVAVGVWTYTEELPSVTLPDRERDGTPGLYVLGEFDLSREDPLEARGLAGFVRAGVADGEVQAVEAYVGGGLAYNGLFPSRREDRLGVGVASAKTSRTLRRTTAGLPEWETALEVTYRAQVFPWLAFQPDFQLVVDPARGRSTDDAVLLGLRTEVVF